MDTKPLTPTPGLLWGFTVTNGVASRLTNETASEALAAPHDWAWLHFALADHRARRYLESTAPVPPAARALLLGNETRQQLHLADGYAYGLLPDIEKDFEGQTLGTGRIAFYLDDRRLITARHRTMRVADEVRQAAEAGAALATPTDAFVHHVEHFLAIVEDRLQQLAHDLDHIEDVVLSDRDDIDPKGLGPARRELSRYRREFSGLRGALLRAQNVRHVPGAAQAPAIACPIAPHLPGLAQAVEDLDRDAAALADRARLLYEEIDSRIASTTNRSLSTLTILSTLLLPPTFIAGAFGMNLHGISWENDPNGFWWALGLCFAVVAAGYLLLRRFRIL